MNTRRDFLKKMSLLAASLGLPALQGHAETQRTEGRKGRMEAVDAGTAVYECFVRNFFCTSCQTLGK